MDSPAPQSFALVITGAPYSSQAPQTALNFAEAAIRAGHKVNQVFLYGDGVHLASNFASPPSDESDWPALWRAFIENHQIPATCCVASALRRGLLDETESRRYEKTGANVTAPYTIAGLGEWLESTLNSSRTLYFNPDH
ncbi:MAG: sulfurtransferase complex subunit TusD [Alteromonadaceae bacterium]|nr:sulfurtransferase complex subunit TusD [Alteromonadaceae bacterium]MBH87456.1 sulfurtransferase complex subunit TusD [Alteromonadaceae bacterium]|tara:strand:+ start:8771 stop:9187 length:417 start_codon:yes stop_codon:yes gene_type:complete